ncbi:hypothetical protein CPB86DRAFT_815793 [Serendipita vermifera]|nr:hypothetical protein CPB86DRAFT_815793 [Serendipita vermifera]
MTKVGAIPPKVHCWVDDGIEWFRKTNMNFVVGFTVGIGGLFLVIFVISCIVGYRRRRRGEEEVPTPATPRNPAPNTVPWTPPTTDSIVVVNGSTPEKLGTTTTNIGTATTDGQQVLKVFPGTGNVLGVKSQPNSNTDTGKEDTGRPKTVTYPPNTHSPPHTYASYVVD